YTTLFRSYKERDEPDRDGGMRCTITYSDGSVETITMDENGGGTTTIVDSEGTTEAVGHYDWDTGIEQIDYSDGSEETVDVDTGEDVSDDSDSDSLLVPRQP